ncbi:protein NEL-like [Pocillopora verrucosa]|uniref:protein NEL-like n=1 Tax=Pocillopora verrucosa TaxID=203993 RepID=UPI0033424801
MVFLSALSLLSLMFLKVSTQQCGIDSYSVYQRMLKGHTFKTVKARPLLLDCKEACTTDYRCQSYNYDWSQSICELNNRTREARPNDFVRNENRYYVREPHKVSLGSIPELPADSCAEIKADEGGHAVSGSYWLDLTKSGNSTLVLCDMTTGVADFCSDNRCVNSATCVNRKMNYTCSCKTGWTGSYCERDVDECTEIPGACPVQSACENSLGSYHCICQSGWRNVGPHNCSEIHECPEEFNHSCPPKSDCIIKGGNNSYECLCHFCHYMSNDTRTCLPDCREETTFYYVTGYTKIKTFYTEKCGWWGWFRCGKSKFKTVSKKLKISQRNWVPNRDGAKCPCP